MRNRKDISMNIFWFDQIEFSYGWLQTEKKMVNCRFRKHIFIFSINVVWRLDNFSSSGLMSCTERNLKIKHISISNMFSSSRLAKTNKFEMIFIFSSMSIYFHVESISLSGLIYSEYQMTDECDFRTGNKSANRDFISDEKKHGLLFRRKIRRNHNFIEEPLTLRYSSIAT